VSHLAAEGSVWARVSSINDASAEQKWDKDKGIGIEGMIEGEG
jgi:hypothetical protein